MIRFIKSNLSPSTVVQKPTGPLWGVAAYFNPLRHTNKSENYRRFRAASRNQGLRLLVVETALNGQLFDLEEDDADIVMRRRSESMLWHKERLINIGIRNLPDDCDQVVWTDTDILYEDDRWVEKCRRMLEKFPVIQPFSEAIQLPQGFYGGMHEAVASSYPRLPSTAHAWAHASPAPHVFSGHCGYAVAARRSLLESVPLYDRAILGSGDAIFLGGCLGIPASEHPYTRMLPKALLHDADAWCKRVWKEVGGHVGYCEGAIGHLWHGDRKNRHYTERAGLISSFDPTTDLRMNEDECWTWASNKPELHANVQKYFFMRNEEGAIQTD